MVPIEDCFEDLRSLLGAKSVSVHDWPTSHPPYSDHETSGQPFARMTVPSTRQQSALNRYLDNSDDHFTLLGSTAAEGSSSHPTAPQNLAQFRTSEDQGPDVENAQFAPRPKVSDTVYKSLAHLTFTSENFGHLIGEAKVINRSTEINVL
jgi:hypothetical protein